MKLNHFFADLTSLCLILGAAVAQGQPTTFSEAETALGDAQTAWQTLEGDFYNAQADLELGFDNFDQVQADYVKWSQANGADPNLVAKLDQAEFNLNSCTETIGPDEVLEDDQNAVGKRYMEAEGWLWEAEANLWAGDTLEQAGDPTASLEYFASIADSDASEDASTGGQAILSVYNARIEHANSKLQEVAQAIAP